MFPPGIATGRARGTDVESWGLRAGGLARISTGSGMERASSDRHLFGRARPAVPRDALREAFVGERDAGARSSVAPARGGGAVGVVDAALRPPGRRRRGTWRR